jgi:hypothetical protein
METTTMFLTICVDCDSEAFQNDPVAEMARVLDQVVTTLRNEGTEQGSTAKLRDSNGKTVGEFMLNMPTPPERRTTPLPQ